MTEPTPDYHARAEMYHLLLAYATNLTNNPEAPALYRTALDKAMASRHARGVVTELLGAALGAYILKYDNDVSAALATIVREMRVADDLAGLDGEGDQ